MMTTLVTDYLEKTADNFPDKVAFADDNTSMTFSELRDSSRRVATVLAKHGFFKQPVAIYLDKSPACIAAFMGVAYSGNFYTPIDVKMPASRVEKIIDTLQPGAIITDEEHRLEAEKFAGNCKVLIYSEMCDNLVDDALLAETRSKIIDTDVL